MTISPFRSSHGFCHPSNEKPHLLPAAHRVDVVFGVPGKNCLGAGICRIMPLDHVRVNWKCPSAIAWLNISDDGKPVLSFDRKFLSPLVFERFFQEAYFEVEGPYATPQGLVSALNIDSFTLKTGYYPIKVSEKYVVIQF